jgi:hypothetical protein
MSMAALPHPRQFVFHYRRGAVAIFYFPSRRGSGRCSVAMDISVSGILYIKSS